MAQNNVAQLIVEGNNDRHVIWALCNQHKVKENFSITTPNNDNGGIEALLKSIPLWLKSPRISALGVVLDADQNLEARWQSIKGRLLDSGYTFVPDRPDPEGTLIIQPKKPKVGIWIMPNNTLPGKLEDFISNLIPKNDELSTITEEILQEIEQKNLNRYSINDRPKAFVHTWLAWQKNPGQPMGLAITAHSLNHNAPLANSFVNWLRKLFDEQNLL